MISETAQPDRARGDETLADPVEREDEEDGFNEDLEDDGYGDY